MSDAGSQQTQTQQTNGQDFSASLPEPLRGNAAFKDIKDVGSLAQKYADSQKPFLERLPEKYRNEAAFKDIKDESGLADSYFNAQKMVGLDKNRLAVLPKDDKDTAGWDAFYKAQGRPDAADKYAFGKRADGTDYQANDVEFQKKIAPILHKMGVTQRQIDAGRGDWDQLQADLVKAADGQRQAEMEKASAALRSKWGGDYDGHMKDAEAAIGHYAKTLGVGDQLIKELSATTFGNNPALAQVFAHMGAQLKEDGLLGKGQGGFTDRPSQEAARTLIAQKEAAFRANATFKNKDAPGRQEALDEIAHLYEAAYPGEETAA